MRAPAPHKLESLDGVCPEVLIPQAGREYPMSAEVVVRGGGGVRSLPLTSHPDLWFDPGSET